jgi:hypothetical protein
LEDLKELVEDVKVLSAVEELEAVESQDAVVVRRGMLLNPVYRK